MSPPWLTTWTPSTTWWSVVESTTSVSGLTFARTSRTPSSNGYSPSRAQSTGRGRSPFQTRTYIHATSRRRTRCPTWPWKCWAAVMPRRTSRRSSEETGCGSSGRCGEARGPCRCRRQQLGPSVAAISTRWTRRMMAAALSAEARAFIEAHRVGRLATADEEGRPHVVPICYAYDGRRIYTALDLKPSQARCPPPPQARSQRHGQPNRGPGD